MLVGDPQQLNPVILLDSKDNEKLMRLYNIPEEYNYIKNSIYKTFLSSDSVSKEILLSHHYRCAPKIIEFNNKKYYNNRLSVETKPKTDNPIFFADISDNVSTEKNIAPLEAGAIIDYAKQHRNEKIGVITPFVKQKKFIENLAKENALSNVSCGTVHAFQGDEKDTVLFSLALTNKTSEKTYNWLNNNREIINVATSRAKDKLVVFGSEKEINRLHSAFNTPNNIDDIYELKNYIKTNGKSKITAWETASRALGIKPYSSQTEEEFLLTLSHALDIITNSNSRFSIKKEVSISAVFEKSDIDPNLFFTGRFDFVLYKRDSSKSEYPVLAIELDGKEHREKEDVMRRDKQKNQICKNHNLILIRVDNTYARRYNFIKKVLEDFFANLK